MSRPPPPVSAPALSQALAEALTLHRAGRLAEAEGLYRAIRKAAPDHPDATYNAALLLGQTGRLGEAVALLRRLVRLHPDFAAAIAALGVFLKDSGQMADAVAALERARDLRPDHAPTWVNLGNALTAAARTDEAVAAYTAALALAPDLPPARLALATLRTAAGDTAAARAVLRQQVALHPTDADGWRRLGLAWAEDHHRADAARAYARAIALSPESEAARHDQRRNSLPMLPDSVADADAALLAYDRELADLAARCAGATADQRAAMAAHIDSPETFLLAYRAEDVTGLMRRHGDLMAGVLGGDAPAKSTAKAGGRAGGSARRGGRIRLVIASQFIRQRHPVWKGLIAGWVAGLDRRRFEVIALPTAPDDSADAQVARRAFDRVLTAAPSTAHPSERDLIRAIGAAAPDILLHPDGPLSPVGHRLSARRLAPVQAATWGHPLTTGLPTLDVFLSADALEPDDAQDHYRERLIRIAGLGSAYRPDTDGIPPFDRAALAERTGGAVGITRIACVQSLYKYLPQHDELFPRIAAGAGPCQFLFFADPAPALTAVFQTRLATAFAAHGLDWRAFCCFLPRTTPEGFYRVVGACDLYLDPPGFSGFNTAQEALSYDVPVVTLEGRFLRGRLAAGVLRRIGLDELVVTDTDAYAALAIALARDADRRAALAARIRAGKSAAWNDPAVVPALEEALAALAALV